MMPSKEECNSVDTPTDSGAQLPFKVDKSTLLAEYNDVTNNIRWLADVRFKLLGLVPLAAIAGAWFAAPDNYLSPGISLFGLVITVALMIYNERNDQLYGDLIGRAGDLERRLGLYDGQFSQRISPWFVVQTPRHINIDHSTAVSWIYKPTIMVWLTGLLYPVVKALLTLVEEGESPEVWLSTTYSVAVSIVLVLIISSGIKSNKRSRKDEMRSAAYQAIKHLRALSEQEPVETKTTNLLNALKYLAIVMGKKWESKMLTDLAKKATFYMSPGNFTLPNPYLPEPEPSTWQSSAVYDLAAILSGQPGRWFFVVYHELGKESVEKEGVDELLIKWKVIDKDKDKDKDKDEEDLLAQLHKALTEINAVVQSSPKEMTA